MSTINSRGQITIPERMREALGLKPGDKVILEFGQPGEVVIRKVGEPPHSRFERLRGSLKSDLSTDEIMTFLRGDD